MQKFYKIFFQTFYFKTYLVIIFLLSVLFLSQKFLYPSDWTTSEWLINYQGGFVRRGFIGEIVYKIHEFSDLNLRYLVFYFEIFLLAIFFILIYNFFKKTYLNELLIFIFFCPIFLIYPLAENEVLVRKEYLFFSIYLIYLNLILSNNKYFYLIILFCLPIMNLTWDGMIFYIYFFIFSFLCKKNINTKEIFLYFLSFVPYLISLYFVIVSKSNPYGLDQMCISINENCFGAMLALDKSLIWNIEFVTSRFQINYFFTYFILIILSFLPILIFSYFDNFEISINRYKINKPLFKLNIILIISILVFMLIGYDWGRWINIGFTFAILTIFFLIKNNNINFLENYLFKITKKFYNNYSKIYYFIFFCYIFTWNMKVIMTDDIGSFPYYRILNKTIKIISMYI